MDLEGFAKRGLHKGDPHLKGKLVALIREVKDISEGQADLLAEAVIQEAEATLQPRGEVFLLESVGVNALMKACEESDVIVIDEVGKIEVESEKFVNAVKYALDVEKPILLKRRPSATLREFLMAAEYVVSHGNPRVALCERGIRTF
ncbi:MAG: hypothetical protein HGA93_06615, partial [Methanothrix sp.]|nr:hypothetical protein [Methanothrix sp.]